MYPSSVGVDAVVGSDPHGRLELAVVAEQRFDLLALEPVDVLHVVGEVGLEQQERLGAVGGESELGEEVRIAGRHQRVEEGESGGPVVGVEPVPTPRVVAQHHVGTEPADDPGHGSADLAVVLELAVDLAEEQHPVVRHPNRPVPVRR